MSGNHAIRLLLLAVLIAIGIAAGAPVCFGQHEMSYILLEGSTLTEECTICGRPPIILPLRGTFRLVLREMTSHRIIYDVRQVEFQTEDGVSPYVVTGEGTLEFASAAWQMRLHVQINDWPDIELESGELPEQWRWPMIEGDVSEEPVDPLRVFSLHLIAAPVREIWFSTRTSFTSGELKQSVSSGDLLSHTGRAVRKNSDLVGRLGIMPMVPDLGLDAVDLASGGEVLFSIEDDVHSETLGRLQHGDLLSERGQIVRTNQELTSAFGPEPVVPDVGLDAVQRMHDGEILFSIEEKIFSEVLGVMLCPGDLLSEKGAVVRTNEKLLANFEPQEGQGDVGLDAIHVWPSGEIWFSTEVGFQSKTLGPIGAGDLLSDTGSIVFRNLQLLRQFNPLEELADFGLDALFLVIEDCFATPSVREVELTLEQGSGNVQIQWLSDGRVFQVERAENPGGPYVPLAPIGPETTWIDKAITLGKKKSFYRIREW